MQRVWHEFGYDVVAALVQEWLVGVQAAHTFRALAESEQMLSKQLQRGSVPACWALHIHLLTLTA